MKLNENEKISKFLNESVGGFYLCPWVRVVNLWKVHKNLAMDITL